MKRTPSPKKASSRKASPKLSPDTFSTREYESDIFSHLKQKELADMINLKLSSDFIRFRRITVDWLLDVMKELYLGIKTYHLAVNIFDRFFNATPNIDKSKIQLLSCACMLIASKYEERISPGIDDFVYISDNNFTSRELKDMESIVLKKLEWKIAEPTCIDFAEYYWHKLKLSKEQVNVSSYILDSSLLNIDVREIPPSLVAASSIFYALKIKGKGWTDNCEKVFGYKESACLLLIPTIKKWLENNSNDKFKYSSEGVSAAKKFYSTKRKDEVALLPILKSSVKSTMTGDDSYSSYHGH